VIFSAFLSTTKYYQVLYGGNLKNSPTPIFGLKRQSALQTECILYKIAFEKYCFHDFG